MFNLYTTFSLQETTVLLATNLRQDFDLSLEYNSKMAVVPNLMQYRKVSVIKSYLPYQFQTVNYESSISIFYNNRISFLSFC